MGCATSSIESEESVRRCKERRRLMKQVVQHRNDFALSQAAYLQSLKNTGATLRQFAEVESSEFGAVNGAPFRVAFPPPPPPPLSPSNTHFTAPVEELFGDDQNDKGLQENIETDEAGSHTPPPPSAHGSSWEFWDPFAPTSPSQLRKTDDSQQVEDEDWAETNTEFEEEEVLETDLVYKAVAEKSPAKEMDASFPKSVMENSCARETDYWVSKVVHDKSPAREMDDNSSMVSWYTKDSDMAMVVWRTKKSLAGIVKDLDDYFLKASAGGKEISILMENNRGTSFLQHFVETKKKNCNSAKVFSSLSWSRSSKSLQASRDSFEFQTMNEAHRPSSLSETLDKLYVEEQKLYEEVKGEEIVKRQHEKEVRLLQRQEAQNQDGLKVEKTRISVERSRSQINSLTVAVATTFSNIVRLRDEDLHPQLVELSGGLTRMWRTMYECHQVQNHIAQQLNSLEDQPSAEATTEHHRLATIQLETEVTALYGSFCKLLKSQRDYIRTLTAWIKLTNCLTDGGHDDLPGGSFALCEQWQLALERLPDKVAAEAIKSFVAVIHSIAVQQAEEHRLRRKLGRMEKRLDKKLKSLSLTEKKYGTGGEIPSCINPKHPLCIKRAKTDAFRKRVDEQRGKYHSAVQVTRAMMLNNLQTGLPNVFQAFTGFSSISMQSFEAIYNQSKGGFPLDEPRSGSL